MSVIVLLEKQWFQKKECVPNRRSSQTLHIKRISCLDKEKGFPCFPKKKSMHCLSWKKEWCHLFSKQRVFSACVAMPSMCAYPNNVNRWWKTIHTKLIEDCFAIRHRSACQKKHVHSLFCLACLQKRNVHESVHMLLLNTQGFFEQGFFPLKLMKKRCAIRHRSFHYSVHTQTRVAVHTQKRVAAHTQRHVAVTNTCCYPYTKTCCFALSHQRTLAFGCVDACDCLIVCIWLSDCLHVTVTVCMWLSDCVHLIVWLCVFGACFCFQRNRLCVCVSFFLCVYVSFFLCVSLCVFFFLCVCMYMCSSIGTTCMYGSKGMW